ncbi:unnamed protein product, partial [Hapterophycus canaliculatus]
QLVQASADGVGFASLVFCVPPSLWDLVFRLGCVDAPAWFVWRLSQFSSLYHSEYFQALAFPSRVSACVWFGERLCLIRKDAIEISAPPSWVLMTNWSGRCRLGKLCQVKLSPRNSVQ